MGAEKPVVLWLSRHKPISSQIEYLRHKLGDYVLVQYARPLPTVEKALELVEMYGADYVVPVLPMTFIMRLVEESKKRGFKVLRADMQLLHYCSSRPCPDFRPQTDVVIESKDLETGGKIYRHFRFRGFKLLKDVRLVEGDW